MNFKAHHISLAVLDLQKSINWYKENLECTLVHEYNKNQWLIALLKLNNLLIELVQIDNNKPLPSYRQDIMSDITSVGTKHICFQVKDLNKTITKLKKKGVELASDVDSAAFGGKFAFIKDCDGILIEIYESSK